MKKSNNLVLVLMATPLLFWQCETKKDNKEAEESSQMEVEEVEKAPSLTLLWETTDELTTCESVLVDKATGSIYVSNIAGDPREKDGEGFISVISKSGEIVNKEWVSGIDAPKGMGILDGKLYVTNIDELVEIDIENASISNTYAVEGAGFLNDVAVYGTKVFFSDMETGKIHVLENGELAVFAEGQGSINGLRVSDSGILYGLDGEGLKKYAEDGSAEVINAVVTGGDGLIVLGEKDFLASRWVGEIWLVQGDSETKLLDTKEAESNTADIGYLVDEKIVLVPTFKKNKVAAYKLDY